MEKVQERYYDLICKDGPISKEIKDFCEAGVNANKKFFGKNPARFKIIVTHKEKSFRKETGKLYFPWAKGYGLKGKKIIVRSIESNERCYKKFKGTRDLSLIIIHEINHIFAYQMNLHKGPYWLFEGIAMHVAGQQIDMVGKNIDLDQAKALLMYRKIRRKQCPEGYVVYSKATEYLISKFGAKKLKKLFSTYKKDMKKKDFEANFKAIYGVAYKEFCNEFLNLD